MKKSILYISPENFTDHNFPVMEHICKFYNLHWLIVFDYNFGRKPLFSEEEIELFARENNVSYTILKKKYRRRNPLNLIFNIKFLIKILKYKTDLIYIETLNDIYFSILSVLFINKKKSILAIHDVLSHVTNKRTISDLVINLTDKLERTFFYNIHLFSHTQAKILKSNYSDKRVFVVPLFLLKFPYVKTITYIKTPKVNFLYWGSIRYNKGLDFLILAAEKLYENGFENFKVTIVGRTKEWETYNSLIKHQEIFELHVSDEFIPIEQVAKLFASSQFLVLPYRDITQSGPLNHAYNYNLPVIASNLDGFKEYIIDGNNGFLFESENIDSLYNVMKMVMSLNETSLLTIKSNLSAFVNKNMSDEVILGKYRSMLDSVIISDK